jgi:hypothetical protein
MHIRRFHEAKLLAIQDDRSGRMRRYLDKTAGRLLYLLITTTLYYPTPD